jgi:hypothetical protein
LTWTLPSEAAGTPPLDEEAASLMEGDGEEVEIRGIGDPTEIRFFGFPLRGIRMFAGHDDNGTYTRFRGDIEIPAFRINKNPPKPRNEFNEDIENDDDVAPDGKKKKEKLEYIPGITISVNVRVDSEGTHLDNIYTMVEKAKLGALEIDTLCLSYVAGGTPSDPLKAPQQCAAFDELEDLSKCNDDDGADRWDATAVLQFPFTKGANGTGIKISGGLADGELSYLAAAADLGRYVPLVNNLVWLKQIRGGLCVGPPLSVTAGLTIGAIPMGPDDEFIELEGNVNYTDSYYKDFTDDCEEPDGFTMVQRCRAYSLEDYKIWIPWTVSIESQLSLAGMEIGNAGLTFGGNKILHGHLDVEKKWGPLGVEGHVFGWVNFNDGRFNVEGEIEACADFDFLGDVCAGMRGLVSSAGLAACLDINLLLATVSIGGSVGWDPLDINIMAPSCDIGEYRLNMPTRRRRAADGTVTTAIEVAKGTKVQVLRLHGVGGATPKVALHGPGGELIEPVAKPKWGESMIVPDPQSDALLVMLVGPAAGTWTVESLDGSPITSVDGAHDVPRPEVKGTIESLADGRQELRYSFTPQPGLKVAFTEVAADDAAAQELGVAAADCATPCTGTIRFHPALGYAGTRNIVADITRDGMPVDRQAFTSYKAPALKPGTVRNVRLRRSGDHLEVCWRPAPNATVHEISAIEVALHGRKYVQDGYSTIGQPKKSCASFPDVKPGHRLQVSVNGNDRLDQLGPFTHRVLRVPNLPTPAAPRGMAIRRLKTKGGIVVSWLPIKHAFRYGVSVVLSNGRTIAVTHSRHCRSAYIPNVRRTLGVRAKVFGVRRDLKAGPGLEGTLTGGRHRLGIKGDVRTAVCGRRV